jgi:hypothetical protein
MRQELLATGSSKEDVARGLIGLDSDRAWKMRKAFLDTGTAGEEVALGLAGLDSDLAWQIKKDMTLIKKLG